MRKFLCCCSLADIVSLLSLLSSIALCAFCDSLNQQLLRDREIVCPPAREPHISFSVAHISTTAGCRLVRGYSIHTLSFCAPPTSLASHLASRSGDDRSPRSRRVSASLL